ncbi:MAG: cysteine--1-D-myo-inosityl 2-amino-2-deoxy-alpha-D-glucopyranoside ligase, partial [Microbacteriaceae bacterium]
PNSGRVEAAGPDPRAGADPGLAELRAVLAEDLDTPAALALLDGVPWTPTLVAASDALLGIRL